MTNDRAPFDNAFFMVRALDRCEAIKRNRGRNLVVPTRHLAASPWGLHLANLQQKGVRRGR